MDQKVEQPPTASEAAEVHSERPKTTAPMGKGYMPNLNLLGSPVWACIRLKQEYRIRGSLIYTLESRIIVHARNMYFDEISTMHGLIRDMHEPKFSTFELSVFQNPSKSSENLRK